MPVHMMDDTHYTQLGPSDVVKYKGRKYKDQFERGTRYRVIDVDWALPNRPDTRRFALKSGDRPTEIIECKTDADIKKFKSSFDVMMFKPKT